MWAELVKVDEIGDLDAVSLIIFASDSCYEELREQFGNIKAKNVFGAVFPGVIFDGKKYEDRAIALRFDFEISGFRGCVPADVKAETLLTLADGFHENVESTLENVYFKLGNTVKYLGGGAGSLNRRIDCLFDKDGFFSNDVLFVSLPFDCNIAVRHGWQETGYSFVSTRTSGRKILELDWTPAFEAYKDILAQFDIEISRKNFFDVAMAYPFGISKICGEDIIRDPLYLDKSSIICAGKVPRNHILKLMRGEKDRLVEAARECAEAVEGNVSFDCISRVLYLGDEFKREARHLKGTFGALTIGEIACSRGIVEFFNKTLVVGGIHEKVYLA
ncbi:FIST signal transduction protein [Archaeoglobus profundus]|uniref:FIST domain-containing protein n=1 Tax=Archaeoglobus profundus (strain DSM 5631 / JCM 9629 / NBRC 100127 / Av18) TaxID=572546 RepID=D2RHB3_ARCPA|nr:FIST C-terminal domain-containing protein [Archaeoglobus profundus]ADB57688.1 domain of unknown function DUF1745 [Archaeoglobus profundus DSM 5631]